MDSTRTNIQSSTDADLRRSILVTSRELLISEGYASLSMRKIARSIGYSATSIYLHFRNKDQLIHALITDGVLLLMRRLRPFFEDEKSDPRVIITKICREYVQFGINNPGYYEIMYILHPASLSRYPEKNYRDARSLIESLTSVFERAVKLGVVRSSDPVLMANVLWSQMHGVVSLVLASRFDVSLNQDRLIQDAVEYAVRSCFVDPVSPGDSI